MMTLATARQRIRYRIGEPTESFWLDVELNSYINDSKDDLYNAILTINKDYFQRSAALKTRAFTNRILLPSDFQRLKVLRMATSGMEGTLFTPADRNQALFTAALANTTYSNQPYQYMFDIWDCIDEPSGSDTAWGTVNGAVNSSTTVVFDDATNIHAGDTVYFYNPTTSAEEDSGVVSAVSGNTATMAAAVSVSDNAKAVVSLRGSNLELSPAPNGVYDLALGYWAQLPDLSADDDTFKFLDPFTGYILDQATYYALSKGPSGDYQNYGTRAEMKLNRILAVASKSNAQGAEFATGFLEDSY